MKTRYAYLRLWGIIIIICFLLLGISTLMLLIVRDTEALPEVVANNMRDPNAPKYDFSENLQQRQQELAQNPATVNQPKTVKKSASGKHRLLVVAFKEPDMAAHHAQKLEKQYQHPTEVVTRNELHWVDFSGLDQAGAEALQQRLEADKTKSWIRVD